MLPSTDDIQAATLALARQLVACKSITPSDGGAIDLLTARLIAAGFECDRLDRHGVNNLWARRGSEGPLICLAGHVDVVPPGPIADWTSDPFTPVERDGFLYGRGTADMKGALAAMVTAAERIVTAGHRGSIALLVTADEEGDATDGTVAVVEALTARDEMIDACILGEPTSAERFGDTIKNGRRGSLNGVLTIRGEQCHIAYPERGRNPIHLGAAAIAELVATEWDRGNDYFQPTSFQISNLHAGAGANNVIPGHLHVLFNFRYSTESTADGLKARVHEVLDRHRFEYGLEWNLSGAPFLTPRGTLVEALIEAVRAQTGSTPQLSTSGGTSDGRFLTAVARQVVEFGPLNTSIHKVDEHIAVADLGPLSSIYEQAVRRMLSKG